MSDKYAGLRESLGAMSQFGEWHRSRSHIDIDESDEWCPVHIVVQANKLASRKVANYLKLVRPDAVRSLLAERDALESVLSELLERSVEPPDADCSCHISPPCADCVEWSGLRETRELARSLLGLS